MYVCVFVCTSISAQKFSARIKRKINIQKGKKSPSVRNESPARYLCFFLYQITSKTRDICINNDTTHKAKHISTFTRSLSRWILLHHRVHSHIQTYLCCSVCPFDRSRVLQLFVFAYVLFYFKFLLHEWTLEGNNNKK